MVKGKLYSEEMLTKKYTSKYLLENGNKGKITRTLDKLEATFYDGDNVVVVEDLENSNAVILDLPTLKDMVAILESKAVRTLYCKNEKEGKLK